jgi:hypothetical protein
VKDPIDLEIGGVTYKWQLTANGLYHLEEATNLTYWEIDQQIRDRRLGMRLALALVFAGLEGARAKLTPRRSRFTLESVGALFDAQDGIIGWLGSEGYYNARTLSEGFYAVLPTPKPARTEGETRPTPAETNGGAGS